MDTNSRIRKFLKSKKITVQAFELSINKTNGYLSHTKSPTAGVLNDISKIYPDVNLEWLITGNGEMLKAEKPILDIANHDVISMEEYFERTNKLSVQISNLIEQNSKLTEQNSKLTDIIEDLRSENRKMAARMAIAEDAAGGAQAV